MVSRRDRRLKALKAVLFDFDGTLTVPGHLDFDRIRRTIGCPTGTSLLAHIESIEDPKERRRAAQLLDRFETEAADRSREDPDASVIVRYCREHGLRMGIITRNSRRSIDRSFARFENIAPGDFAVIITRDDPFGVKPAPDGVIHACKRLGIDPGEAVLVGDYLYDIEAGERAGSTTIFYDSDPGRSFKRPDCDHTITRLGELTRLLSLYFPLPAGKVPNELLSGFLKTVSSGYAPPASGDAPSEGGDEAAAAQINAAAVLIGPGIGEDVAAIALEGVEASAGAEAGGAVSRSIMLLKSDPITFAAENFGHYLLTVNANDIATAGGEPRWLLATAFLPPGTLGAEIARLFENLGKECARFGIVLCGGHTELTDAVTRPLVSATMIGTVDAERLIRKETMGCGDTLLLTKGIAVEGTVLLATEHGELLRKHGVGEALIGRGAGLSGSMSIVREARIAARHGGVSAMHDVTEGGVATALRELSAAGGHRIRVDLDSVPVLPETAVFCSALSLDPLGLIGSGSLLISVREPSAAPLIERFSRCGVAVSVIGTVLDVGEEVIATRSGRFVELPSFLADEITRVATRGAGGASAQLTVSSRMKSTEQK